MDKGGEGDMSGAARGERGSGGEEGGGEGFGGLGGEGGGYGHCRRDKTEVDWREAYCSM